MHWKTIKYLTKNYKTILIDDINCKSIVSNETNVLSNILHYEFRQRLSNAYKGRGKSFLYINYNNFNVCQ